MAERRMVAKTIVDGDIFLEMPATTQLLYFHLLVRADDDGFINNPKRLLRMIGVNDDDMKLLIARKFIIPFDSGVVVIKHWRIHNYIQKDRYKCTSCLEEKSQLKLSANNSYELNFGHSDNIMDTKCIQDSKSLDTECIQNVSSLDTQVSIGKDSIGKDRLDKDSIDKKQQIVEKIEYADDVKMTQVEFDKLNSKYGADATLEMINMLSNYKGSTGKKYKSDYKAILSWVVDKYEKRANEVQKSNSKHFTRDNNPIAGIEGALKILNGGGAFGLHGFDDD